LQQGLVGPAQLGTSGYLYETPERRILTEYWTLIWDGRLAEAIEYAQESGYDRLGGEIGRWFTCYPGRPDYFTHWGEGFRYAASVLGLPVGDYPHSRAPQAILPEEAKVQIRKAYENLGFAKQPAAI
jgi:4-hydroxy-tetrahydrodipicolinate synthase